MSLRLMKERIKISGISPRDEMIRDGQNLLKEELEHDTSYSPTMYFYDAENEKDDRLANFRVYGRKNSSLNGNYMNYLTTYDNPVKIGDYIHDTKDDTYWLVYTAFNVNDIEYTGKLIQCNYLLRWQLSDGKIIQRWTNIVSASKYDTGENGNSTIVLSSNNFTILMGYCDEALELEEKRVIIDIRKVPKKVFKITRGDDVLYNAGSIGMLLSFIADKTELNKDKDNQELGICDYIHPATPTPPKPSNPDETADLSAKISGNTNLRIGVTRTYTVTLSDKEGNAVQWNDTKYSWNVISDFDVRQTVTENKISLTVEDEDFIDSSFLLQVIKLNDSSVLSEIEITVIDVM